MLLPQRDEDFKDLPGDLPDIPKRRDLLLKSNYKGLDDFVEKSRVISETRRRINALIPDNP